MSKRAGKIVTMDDLIDEVGKDAARYFFIARKANAHLNFDLELALQQNNETLFTTVNTPMRGYVPSSRMHVKPRSGRALSRRNSSRD